MFDYTIFIFWYLFHGLDHCASLNSTNISSECMHSSIIQSFPDLLDNSLTSPHPCSSIENENFDIGEIFELRTKNLNNPFIGFLNINSLRNKITDLRLIMERCLPDILVIEETKLNSDFKTPIAMLYTLIHFFLITYCVIHLTQ